MLADAFLEDRDALIKYIGQGAALDKALQTANQDMAIAQGQLEKVKAMLRTAKCPTEGCEKGIIFQDKSIPATCDWCMDRDLIAGFKNDD